MRVVQIIFLPPPKKVGDKKFKKDYLEGWDKVPWMWMSEARPDVREAIRPSTEDRIKGP